jgi:SAM-dependent methyltransferase
MSLLKERLFQTPFWHRFFKSRAETGHWKDQIHRIVRWYQGEEAYVFPFPGPSSKEVRFDLQTNAILTFITVETAHGSYLKDLQLRPDSFQGLKVGDIGSGPLPTLLVFEGCHRYGIDHLMSSYRELGYPLDRFANAMNFIEAKAEDLPFEDGFFDVMISRNALDHVDDFEAAAHEIKRVLKPDGGIHILLNYHQPTVTEPLILNDERVQENFGLLGIRKIAEQPDAWGFKGGKTVLWSNLPSRMLAEEIVNSQASREASVAV